MDKDHAAMEALRFASLRRGWKWRFDGMDLCQVIELPGAENIYDDPATAVLEFVNTQKK